MVLNTVEAAIDSVTNALYSALVDGLHGTPWSELGVIYKVKYLRQNLQGLVGLCKSPILEHFASLKSAKRLVDGITEATSLQDASGPILWYVCRQVVLQEYLRIAMGGN